VKELLLEPQDVLFFKDGRPMFGSSPGRGASLPMQHVLNGALHAAFHRAFPEEGSLPGEKIHSGRKVEGGFRFGNLSSLGPFLSEETTGDWFFPRPLDLSPETGSISHQPMGGDSMASSLSSPLVHPVVSLLPPSKEALKESISRKAFEKYLSGEAVDCDSFRSHDDFFIPENTVGIGLNAETNSVEKGMLYTAEHLRLKDGIRLGAYAELPLGDEDALSSLFAEDGRILVGGESRLCRVERRDVGNEGLKLPVSGSIVGKRVKFVLLTPAIFPATSGKVTHSGGWLPNWINPADGSFLLLDGPGSDKVKRLRFKNPELREGRPIGAKLVAALLGKPEIITGWAAEDVRGGGAKSTLMAVPAGSVYYFEADDETEAAKLAACLDWRGGEENPSKVLNRRSGLMGEKGYGIGVCASWNYFPNTE
jgi:CRISPR-associated protein Cmr3